MLPGVKFPGEEIVRAALTLVREQGSGLQNTVHHLSVPHRSRGCVCGISCGVCRR